MKGTTVQLVETTTTSYDPFGNPIVEEDPIDIPDVLVGQPTTDDITTSTEVYGKRLEYVLGIPKGDDHDWVNKKVYIWGEAYMTFGYPVTGEQANIPLRWGKNVKVERYGG